MFRKMLNHSIFQPKLFHLVFDFGHFKNYRAAYSTSARNVIRWRQQLLSQHKSTEICRIILATSLFKKYLLCCVNKGLFYKIQWLSYTLNDREKPNIFTKLIEFPTWLGVNSLRDKFKNLTLAALLGAKLSLNEHSLGKKYPWNLVWSQPAISK